MIILQSDDEDCFCRWLKLKVFYTNAGSLNPGNNTPAFREKIHRIKNVISSEKPNIVIFVETWLTNNHQDDVVISQLGLHGYTIFRQDREMPNENNAYVADGDLENPAGDHKGGWCDGSLCRP